MLIKCANKRILNSKHIRTYVVEKAEDARNYSNGSGTTEHPTAPTQGYVVCAWLSGKAFLTDGLSEIQAHQVLDALLAAYADGLRTFDATKN